MIRPDGAWSRRRQGRPEVCQGWTRMLSLAGERRYYSNPGWRRWRWERSTRGRSSGPGLGLRMAAGGSRGRSAFRRLWCGAAWVQYRRVWVDLDFAGKSRRALRWGHLLPANAKAEAMAYLRREIVPRSRQCVPTTKCHPVRNWKSRISPGQRLVCVLPAIEFSPTRPPGRFLLLPPTTAHRNGLRTGTET